MPKQIEIFQFIVLIQFLSKVNEVNIGYMGFESLKQVYRKPFKAFLKMHIWGSIDTNMPRNH